MKICSQVMSATIYRLSVKDGIIESRGRVIPASITLWLGDSLFGGVEASRNYRKAVGGNCAWRGRPLVS